MHAQLFSLSILLGVALAVPAPAITEAPVLAKRAASATIILTNLHDSAQSISIASNAGVALAGAPATRTALAAHAAHTYVLPSGWAGNFGYGAGYYTTNSLIEANFVNGILYPDVSYVNGFSSAAVCQCAGASAPQTGCNLDLWSLNTCGNEVNGNCVNPERSSPNGPASPFFAPCQGAAFTYPDDTGANTQCANGVVTITCYLGNAAMGAPRDPKQKS